MAIIQDFIIQSGVQVYSTATASNTYTGALQVTGGAGIGGDLYATALYDAGNRVLTSVTPSAGTAISISNVSTSSGNSSFTINNTGVTTATGSTYLGVSASNGAVTFTNLGVQTLTGTTALAVSASTGTITLTNLGVTQLSGSTALAVSASTGSITLTNLGVQTLTAGTDTVVSSSTGTVTVWNNSTLQSVTGRGATTDQAISITDNSTASSTNTGALQVVGGVGIGGNLYIGGNLSVAGAEVLTTSTLAQSGVTNINGTTYIGVSAHTGSVTITNLGVTNLSSGTGISLDASTGSVTISNDGVIDLTSGTNISITGSKNNYTINSTYSYTPTDTLEDVTGRGATSTNSIHISNATQSTTCTDGALVVDGGVGIGGNLNVNGATTFGGTVTFNGTATYVYSTNSVYTDNLIELHVPPGGVNGTWGTDDQKDIGLRFHYYNGADQNAGLVFAGDSKFLEFYNTGFESTGTFTGTYGTFRTGDIQLVSGTDAGNTQSGSLQVTGGAGIGGSVYIGGKAYIAGAEVITTATIGSSGVSSITASTGISVNTASGSVTISNIGVTSLSGSTYLGVSASTGSVTLTNLGVTNLSSGTGISLDASTGSVTISNDGVIDLTAGTNISITGSKSNYTINSTYSYTPADTLSDVTGRGATTGDAISITNSTASSDYSHGALTVTGGVGIGGDLNVGGAIQVAGSGGDITGATNISASNNVTAASFTATDHVEITGTQNATSSTIAALTVAGGVGISQDLWVHGDINIDGNLYMKGVGLDSVSSTTGTFVNVIVTGTNTSTYGATTGALTIPNGGVYIGGNVVSDSTVVAGSGATAGTVVESFLSSSFLVAGYTSNTFGTSGTKTLDTWDKTAYRSAKYHVQAVDGSSVHVAEIMIIHDGSDAYISTYGIVTNLGELGTFSATVGGSNVTLTFTPNYTPSALVIKLVRTTIDA
jgi:hypothetical protein